MTVWDDVLARVRSAVDGEEFRRWLEPTAYASDSGDQLTVWVPTEVIRRHLTAHFQSHIDGALNAIGREGTLVRYVVTGVGEDDEEHDA